MHYYDSGDRFRALWIPVFAHLLVWSVCLLMEYIIAGYDAWYDTSERTQHGTGYRSVLRPAGQVGGGRGFQAPAGSNVDERTRLLAGEEAPDTERVNPRIDRFRRAAQAARTTFLMLLSAAVFVSLPIATMCEVPSDVPGAVVRCERCVRNGVVEATPILVWSFFGLSGIWVVLELFASPGSRTGTSVIRAIMGTIVAPVIIAVWGIGVGRWADLRRLEDECGK